MEEDGDDRVQEACWFGDTNREAELMPHCVCGSGAGGGFRPVLLSLRRGAAVEPSLCTSRPSSSRQQVRMC